MSPTSTCRVGARQRPGFGGECHPDANIVRSALRSVALVGPAYPPTVHASLGAGQQGRLLQRVDFDLDLFLSRLDRLDPRIERMAVSAGTREGLERLRGWDGSPARMQRRQR